MKAIACSQCGAIIEEFSSSDEFAECSYCNAKFRMREAKIEDIPRKEVIRINARVLRYSADMQNVAHKSYSRSPLFFLGIGIVILLIAVLGVWIVGYQSGSMLFGADLQNLEYSVSAQQKVSTLNYSSEDYSKLKFDNLEFPDFFTTELHNYSKSDIATTILAERTIRVDAKIDKNGQIIEAEALNGHKYIKKVCETAALKSSFYPPTNESVTLIYRFKLTE